MKSFESLEAMINATMPKDLDSKEEVFFRKWFLRFHINNGVNTNAFCDLIQKSGIDKKSFRDRLYSIGVKCQNDADITALKYCGRTGKDLQDYILLLNQKSMLNIINYILDEIEIIDTEDSKTSKIYTAIGHLDRLITQMKYQEFAILKKIIKKVMRFENIGTEKLVRLFRLSDLITLNEEDKSWICKARKKLNVDE